jgi:hypothetical protein
MRSTSTETEPEAKRQRLSPRKEFFTFEGQLDDFLPFEGDYFPFEAGKLFLDFMIKSENIQACYDGNESISLYSDTFIFSENMRDTISKCDRRLMLIDVHLPRFNHANFIVVDLIDREIELFDPNGRGGEYGIVKQFEKIAFELPMVRQYDGEKLPESYTVLKTPALCAGPQCIHRTPAKLGNDAGWCQLITILYATLRAMNPAYTVDEIRDYLDNFARQPLGIDRFGGLIRQFISSIGDKTCIFPILSQPSLPPYWFALESADGAHVVYKLLGYPSYLSNQTKAVRYERPVDDESSPAGFASPPLASGVTVHFFEGNVFFRVIGYAVSFLTSPVWVHPPDVVVELVQPLKPFPTFSYRKNDRDINFSKNTCKRNASMFSEDRYEYSGKDFYTNTAGGEASSKSKYGNILWMMLSSN